MHRLVRVAAASGLLFCLGAVELQAQARLVFGLGGGVVFPMKSGFNAVESPALSVKSLGFGGALIIGILPKEDSKVSIRFDLGYGNVHYETPTPARDKDPKMSIRNINADVVFHVGNQNGKVRPYILAGPTFVSWDYRTGVTSSTAAGTGKVKGSFGFNGGAGLNFGSGKNLWFFAESRIIWTKAQAVTATGTEKGTSFIPLLVGIRIKPMGKTG